MFVTYFLLLLLFSNSAFGIESSKAIEGYPEGFLGNCPGSTKPAIITKRSLRYLSIVVTDSNGISRRTYNYFQAKKMAKDPHLDFKKKTVLYCGGFLDSPNFLMAGIMAQAYGRLGYNVLLVDANRFNTLDYPLVARYMRPVGKHLAEMLTNLTAAGLDPKRLELVGLSLGGQTISFIAKHFQQLTGRNVSKLIALDPAGPCFRNLGPQDRLDAADGDFVQVVSTNIDGYGMAAPVGHATFYINGGEYQPSDIYWIPCNVLCSHGRSFTIWFSVLYNPDGFIGIKCDSVQQARKNECFDRLPRETNVLSNTKTERNNTGIFYVATGNFWPYYLGTDGLKKENEFWTKHQADLNKDDVIQI